MRTITTYATKSPKLLMSLLQVIILFLLVATQVQAQDIEIADSRLKSQLLSANVGNGFGYVRLDQNEDGIIQLSEALALDTLTIEAGDYSTITTNNGSASGICGTGSCTYSYVVNWAISSLEGLEHFKNIKRLNIINPFGLGATDLRELENLEEFEITSERSSLNNCGINVTGLSNLKKLNIRTSLNSLHFKNCQRLEDVSIEYLNYAEALDFTQSPELSRLSLKGGTFTEVIPPANNKIKEISFYSLDILSFPFDELKQVESISIVSCHSLTELKLNAAFNLETVTVKSNYDLIQAEITNCPKLENLSIWNNNVTQLTISQLPLLESLTVAGNELTELDLKNFTSLKYLNASSNNLKKIGLGSFQAIETIYLGNNEIEEIVLQNLPELNELYLYNNKFRYLDLSALYSLKHIDVSNNEFLEQLNISNGSTEEIIKLKNNITLNYVCADSDDFAILEEVLVNDEALVFQLASDCNIDNDGRVNYVEGVIRFDEDENGCDENDIPMPYKKLTIQSVSDNGMVLSNESGYYKAYGAEELYSFSVIDELDYMFDIDPSQFDIDFATNPTNYTQDICYVKGDTNYDNLCISLIPIGAARPGFKAEYKIIYKNIGNTTLSGQVVFNYNAELMEYLESTPTMNQGTNELVLPFENLKPFEEKEILIILELNSPMDTPALVGGEQIYFTATIDPMDADIQRENNIANLEQDVVNSYDPNDKTCLEGENISIDQIGDFVHYQIRFENTGSASAVNIKVRDTIDTEVFDIASFEVVDASHEMHTKVVEGNIIVFSFDRIYLPHEDEFNDGYLVFKIRTYDDLALGVEISNSAGIYFDFNFPIITNTATSTFRDFSVIDVDGDGYANDVDCDDTNASLNPGIEEIPNNDIDENCDGIILTIDEDNDGYNSDEDCDDNNPNSNPSVEEIANNDIDENCDGLVLIIDNDGDGYNSSEDCDDNNDDINPGQLEIPNNDIDEDCDGEAQIIDVDNDGYNSDEDCNDHNSSVNPYMVEIPNNDIDEDCDGYIWIIDEDNDGYNSSIDCDDTNPDIHPNAEEIPNNMHDDDCHGGDLNVNEYKDYQINIYPNPFLEVLNINTEHDIDVKIINQIGTTVFESSLSRGSNEYELTNLTPGFYKITFSYEGVLIGMETLIKN